MDHSICQMAQVMSAMNCERHRERPCTSVECKSSKCKDSRHIVSALGQFQGEYLCLECARNARQELEQARQLTFQGIGARKLRFRALTEENRGAQRKRFLVQLTRFLDQSPAEGAFERLKGWLTEQGWDCCSLGRGIHRIVYAMPFNMVVKTPRGNGRNMKDVGPQEANWNEYQAYLTRPKLCAKVFLFHEATNLLFMQRATDIGGASMAAKRRLGRVFPDMHDGNIGKCGRKWVAIDIGFGEGQWS